MAGRKKLHDKSEKSLPVRLHVWPSLASHKNLAKLRLSLDGFYSSGFRHFLKRLFTPLEILSM